MSEYDADLKFLDGDHDPSAVPERKFGDVPDGEYQCRLDKIYLAHSKEKKTLMTVIEFEVASGPHVARRIFIYRPMASAKNLDGLTQDFRVLGMPANFKWSQIEQAFPSFLDNFYLIRLVTKTYGQPPDDKTATYKNILKRLSSDEVMQSKAVASSSGNKGDVPF